MNLMGFNVLMTVFVVLLFIILTPGILFSLPNTGSIKIKALLHGILFALLYYIMHKTLSVERFASHPPAPRGPCPGGYTQTPDGVSCTIPTCPNEYTMSTDKTKCSRVRCPDGFSYTDKHKNKCGIITCKPGWRLISSDGHKYCGSKNGYSQPTIFGPDIVDVIHESQPTDIKTINTWA